jgi:hypothetical protein
VVVVLWLDPPQPATSAQLANATMNNACILRVIVYPLGSSEDWPLERSSACNLDDQSPFAS